MAAIGAPAASVRDDALVSLLDEAVEAQGGMARWRAVEQLRVAVRCGGLAFKLKGQGETLRSFTATVDTHRPHVVLDGIGTFDAAEPRPPGMARRLRWDTADIVHFAGYALWGYLAAPFMLVEHDFRVRELPKRRLHVTFPPEIPTHSREQVMWFSPDAVLQRLDYTAYPLGPWARAANVCLEHRRCDGLLVATHRRVTPRGLPAPTMVSIAIDDVALVPPAS